MRPPEGQQLTAADLAFDNQAVAWQRLASRDVAQLECESLERRQARRLVMEMPEIEPPATILPTGMLADQTIEPTLQTSRQPEIGPVDGEHERVIEYGAVEPVRNDEIDAAGVTVTVGALGSIR